MERFRSSLLRNGLRTVKYLVGNPSPYKCIGALRVALPSPHSSQRQTCELTEELVLP